MADIRVSRTNAMLCEALDALMNEKTYDKITVSEICERSTVRRGTFYRHFEDKDALLRYYLTTVTDRLMAQAQSAEKLEDLESYASSMQSMLIDEVRSHPVLYRYLLRKNAPIGVLDMMVNQVADGIVKRIEKMQEAGDAPKDVPASFIGLFYSGGMMHVLRLWLSEEHPSSPDELVARCTAQLMGACQGRLP